MTVEDHADALELYRALAGNTTTVVAEKANFGALLAHPGTSLHGVECQGHIRAMATLHILPNLTHGGRAYALLENVVTLPGWRRQGLGQMVLEHAIARAWGGDCYKIMLLTGVENKATGFYEKLGFESSGKTGMQLRRSGGPARL